MTVFFSEHFDALRAMGLSEEQARQAAAMLYRLRPRPVEPCVEPFPVTTHDLTVLKEDMMRLRTEQMALERKVDVLITFAIVHSGLLISILVTVLQRP
jgi:hypothetical protein